MCSLKIKAYIPLLLTCKTTIKTWYIESDQKWNEQIFFNKCEHAYNSVRGNPVYDSYFPISLEEKV